MEKSKLSLVKLLENRVTTNFFAPLLIKKYYFIFINSVN